MAKSMTKSAIIAHLAQKTDLSKKQVNDVMDQLLSLATKEAKNVFVLPNFGRLVLANRKARMGRNPQTGEPIKIPAKRVVKFRLAKSLKDLGLVIHSAHISTYGERVVDVFYVKDVFGLKIAHRGKMQRVQKRLADALTPQ